MKAIMVRDGINCKFGKFDFRGGKRDGGNIKCEISDNKIVSTARNITLGAVEIPTWCPLSDWKEAISFGKEMGFI